MPTPTKETRSIWLCALSGVIALAGASCVATTTSAPTATPNSQSTQTESNAQLAPAPTATQPERAGRQCEGVVLRPFARNSETGQYDESVLQGLGAGNFKLGDPVVVYYKDPTGIEFPAAVLKIVEINATEDAMIGKLVFLRPGIDVILLGTLSGLCVDRNISAVNLERLEPVGRAFVGFILPDDSRIRIRPEANLKAGDELKVARISKGGNPVIDEATNLVVTVIENEATARVTHNLTSWADNRAELLVFGVQTLTATIEVQDYLKTDICVSAGDTIEIYASGRIYAGQYVKDLGPEGKDKMLGVIPIDPDLNVVPAFPHGALMVRIEPLDKSLDPDEGWLSYSVTRTFVAYRSGCLAFNVNDKQKQDNSGQFDVEISVRR